jgi:hypothetical protein
LITAGDMAMAAAQGPQALPTEARVVAFRERILLVVLYVTVLASSVAFIEPSPHDALMGVLAVCCVVAGVRFERKTALLILLLLVWNVAGLMSLLNVSTEAKAIQYTATSFYLAITAVIFACLFAQNIMPRLATMRAAYILTAVLAALEAISGYFHLFPGSSIFLAMDRGAGTFKDPNVFGPFLVWPILFVMQRVIARRITLRDLLILGILSIGLFLSFSRGAWVHMAVSGFVLLALLFFSAPDTRFRMRLVTLSLICIVAIALLIVALLSLDSVREMFQQRAQAVQYYDVGEGGRFRLQELAFGALLDYPNGMGPFEFARIHGVQQHNVYLQAFMVYGWIGGATYLIMLATTLMLGLRTVFVATPWQPYLLTALAAFAGEVFEGVVIDSDHWRHFYLLLGMVWGLGAASINSLRQQHSFSVAPWPASTARGERPA